MAETDKIKTILVIEDETELPRIPQREKAFSMGAAGYLVKPLSAAELRKTVSRILHDKE